jgi:uncharacterized protein
MNNFSLLIKPASADCNLRCDYCFYIEHLTNKKTRMNYETLEKVIYSYMSNNQNQYSFAWQGGEPTIMGVEFFKKALELQTKLLPKGSSLVNSLQTNATLIDEEMAAFFTENKFLLGVSLDGPRSYHNLYRKTIEDGPSHAKVMQGIDCLRKAKTEFNILTLVSNINVQNPKEIYKYFKDKGFFYHQYIPCVEEKMGKTLPWSITGEQWGDFLLGIFKQWVRNDIHKVSIREFDSIINYLVTGVPSVCTMDKDCRQYFVVEYSGDIYPCDFFVSEEMKLGNINNNNFEELWESEQFRKFGKAKMDFSEDCLSCPYLELCYGGCQKNRINRKKTLLCEGYKNFYKETLPVFREIVSDLRNNR